MVIVDWGLMIVFAWVFIVFDDYVMIVIFWLLIVVDDCSWNFWLSLMYVFESFDACLDCIFWLLIVVDDCYSEYVCFVSEKEKGKGQFDDMPMIAIVDGKRKSGEVKKE